MTPHDVDELTWWQYTALIVEHNSRVDEAEAVTKPWTAEEYQAELEALRERNDPRIRV